MAQITFGSPRKTVASDQRGSCVTLLHVVVGVTGHRNPRATELPRMRIDFEAALGEIASSAPNSPITLLSSLARGADQHAATWALDWGRRHPLPGGVPRVRLVVPRPLPRDDYLADFVTEQERDDYLVLERQAWIGFDLPLGRPEGARPIDRDPVTGRVSDCDGRQDRAEHYRRLGRFMAQQSHVMVAFWDGVPPALVGGTAEVVHFCRSGGTLNERGGGAFLAAPYRERCPELSSGDPTPLWIVTTPREGLEVPANISPAVGGSSCHDLDHDLANLRRTLSQIDRLNRLILEHGTSDATAQWRERNPFRGTEVARDIGFEETCGLFEAIDAVASAGKRSFLRRMRWFGLLTALAIVMFQAYSSFSSEAWGQAGLVGYVLLLIAAFLLHRSVRGDGLQFGFRVRGEGLQWVFIHARAHAEVLRIQLAMSLCGFREEVADWGVAHRELEIRPLRMMMRGTALGLLGMPISSEQLGWHGIHEAVDGWLRHQRRYWQPESETVRSRRSRERRLAMEPWLRVGVFVVATLLLAFEVATWHPISVGDAPQDSVASQVTAWGCLLAGTLLALVAGMGLWRQVSLDGEDLRQFARMDRVFGLALKRLDDARTVTGGVAVARSILRAAGREQFDDTCTWFVRHRDGLPDVASG